jgi:hypothetical protein
MRNGKDSMRQLIRLWLAAMWSLAIVATLAGPAIAASTLQAKEAKSPTLGLCGIAASAVASAHVESPCREHATTTLRGKQTPIGRAPTVVIYGANWGTPSSAANPRRFAEVTVAHLQGSGPTLEFAKKEYRLKVLAHGAPVTAGKGATASLLTEPFACFNPPTHQCSNGSLLAITGNWVIQVGVEDYPATTPGAPELELAAAEAAIKQTEELMKPRIVAIGKVVAGKL